MALDPYALCPCGNGKKLKFCECASESAELEKILNAINGDQRVAALDMLNRQLALHPKNKAMLSLKLGVLAQLQNMRELKATVQEFMALAPKNPNALAYAALCDLEEESLQGAIQHTHESLAQSGEFVPELIPILLFGLSQTLAARGNYVAARAHLVLLYNLEHDSERGNHAARMLSEIDQDADVPLVAKENFSWRIPPANAAYHAEFLKALDASRQNWSVLAAQFAALDRKYPGDEVILFNLACAQSYLALPAAAESWRRYSRCSTVAERDAIDAEMLAQELEPLAEQDLVEKIRVVYKVKDANVLLERFTSDKRVIRLPHEERAAAATPSPPPRGVYSLLDREFLESEPSTGLTREQIPVSLGELYLYGRETDRDARLEFVITKTNAMLDKVRRLQEVGGDQLGMIEKEEKLGTVYALDEALSLRWRLPAKTSRQEQRRLLEEQYRVNMLERLPQLPLQLFGGKTAREVSADPQYRLPLLALIRRFELQYERDGFAIDFGELRRSLGLPPREKLDPATCDVELLPCAQLDLLDVSLLTPAQAKDVLRRASYVAHSTPVRTICTAALASGVFPEGMKRSEVLEILARFDHDPDVCLKLALEAQDAARSEGRSPAKAMLLEFDIRLVRGEFESIAPLIRELQTKHGREPGIGEALYGRLMQLGVINPDGSPRFPSSAPGQVPELTAAGPQSGGLWTPEAAAPKSAEPSKLWLPGMD